MAKRKPAKPKARTARKAAPRKKVQAVPERYGAITPMLVVRGGTAAMDFYEKAFGARRAGPPMMGPEDKVMHAEMTIGGRFLMLADEFPEMGAKGPATLGGSPVEILLYVKDVDAAFRRAIEAGATSVQEPRDEFWGDRYGRLRDPFGHQWSLASHVEDVSMKEMKRRMAELPPPPGMGG